jgi:hypothetical protein
MKQVRLHITRYICGHPLKSNDKGVSLTKEGFPKRFLYLKELIDSGSYTNLRAVMSLVSYTRSILPTNEEIHKQKLDKLVDLTPIYTPYKGKKYSIPMYFVENWVKSNNLKSLIPTYNKQIHYISSKSSPFGKSTISGAYALSQIHTNF